MKNEFEKLIEGLWIDNSPIMSYQYFELAHLNKRGYIEAKRTLRKNWTNFIIEPIEEIEKLCGYCGSENIHPENATQTMCWDCNSVFRNEDIGSFVA